MAKITIEILSSLQKEVDLGDPKIKKLFEKQKQFMGLDPWHPSLGRTKLQGVFDKYGDPLWEIRLNKKDRIVFVERGKEKKIIWLKIVSHDSLSRKNTIHAKGDYKNTQ